ncbi:hypothetical protein AVEN_90388-1 [Araneus ventricosus]|uniref:Transposase Tc1-like domain-containing protein n=1 Tax=Araneus ventricosus TaxID=182803 RepID=A0A4Y2FY86_ARAVE|nr:hypothetical protein AVEN_90388-1 [Araneus ventricosus]
MININIIAVILQRGRRGRGGLMVRPRLWGRRVPASRLDLKIRRALGLLHSKSYVGDQTSSRWCGVEVWRGVCQLRRRPRRLTTAETDDVHPKIAFAMLQNIALICDQN